MLNVKYYQSGRVSCGRPTRPMRLLSKVEYEREEFCRFDDYARYAKHIARKLHTLRRSATSQHDILLFSAERAWAVAMQTRANKGKHQLVLNKLRKAQKYASQLVDLTSKSDAASQLQSIVYNDILRAILFQERSLYDESVLYYSRALVALQNSSPALLEAVETGLRFSIYQSGAEERSINLQKFAIQQSTANDPQGTWRDLVNQVNPAGLKEEKGEEMITRIEWASRSAQLTNPELAAAISEAISGRNIAKARSDPSGFDSVLAAWATASATLQGLLDREEDQDVSQELEVIKAWVSYHSAMDRIARDKALVATVELRDGVLLCDSIINTYHTILALPGITVDQTKSLEKEYRETRGERCLLLAKTHRVSLEAVALTHRALTYFDVSTTRHREVLAQLNRVIARHTLTSSEKSYFRKDRWFTGEVKRLGKSNAQDKRTTSVTMKPVVFDIAWNYILAGRRQEADLANSHNKTNVTLASQDGDLKNRPASSNAAPRKGLFGGLFGGS